MNHGLWAELGSSLFLPFLGLGIFELLWIRRQRSVVKGIDREARPLSCAAACLYAGAAGSTALGTEAGAAEAPEKVGHGEPEASYGGASAETGCREAEEDSVEEAGEAEPGTGAGWKDDGEGDPEPEAGFGGTAEGPAGYDFSYPPGWEGKYVQKDLGENAVAVCQKQSFESMGDGLLFTLRVYGDTSYLNAPDCEVWGYDGRYVYAVSRPTDVAFDPGLPGAMEEYGRMQAEIGRIRESFSIRSDSARYDGEEFVIPNSSSVRIAREDVMNLSEEQLRIARNEIYARHGLIFTSPDLAGYFGQKSWYQGTVGAEAFSDSLPNEQEKQNVKLLAEEEKGRGVTVPKKGERSCAAAS